MTQADFFNVPTEIELDGTVYKLRPLDQVEQGKFQRWLEERAWAALERSAAYRSPEEVAADRRALTAEIAAGVYEWDGPVGAASQQTPEGAAKVLQILLGVPPETARRLALRYLERVLPALQAMMGGAVDPKALGEALATLGLPPDFLGPTGGGSKRRGTSSSKTPRSTRREKKSGR